MVSVFYLLSLAIVCGQEAASMHDSLLDTHWENFKRIYDKRYSSRAEDTRRSVWESNIKEIIRHNLDYDLGLHSYRKGQNEYADMSHEEFLKTLGVLKSYRHNMPPSISMPNFKTALPDFVDWRKEGLVTEVKNQGPLGAAWAFSAAGALEGQHKKKTGKLVPLSEQNLVDCVNITDFHDLRSPMDAAFEYVKKNGGIDAESCYGLSSTDPGTCRFNKSCIGATCSGYADIALGDESALQQAVALVGPISVAIDASQVSFQLYSSGVYDEPNCNEDELDHAVLIVGYGTENGQDYWLVKNSWGKSWGENGYIKMSRNKNDQCGIAILASYPLV